MPNLDYMLDRDASLNFRFTFEQADEAILEIAKAKHRAHALGKSKIIGCIFKKGHKPKGKPRWDGSRMIFKAGR